MGLSASRLIEAGIGESKWSMRSNEFVSQAKKGGSEK